MYKKLGKYFKKHTSVKYELLAIGLACAIAWVYFYQGGNQSTVLLVASIIGIYMAMNLGANDVANNMGPAVGAKALTLGGAIIIAAIFEAGGALIAGGDVVNTIKGGIIDSAVIDEPKELIAIMMATLIGAALWINLATILRAPVSATHSIIGGLIGAGIISNGFGIVKWSKIGEIAASWVISPVLGGLIAALILYSITRNIIKQEDRSRAAERWVPVYIGIMGAAFTAYLALKGLKKIVSVQPQEAIFGGILVGVILFISGRVYLKSKRGLLKDSKKYINSMFNVPLVFAVALLSFAHGANDVANAIGPLAAIADVIKSGNIGTEGVGIPLWVMLLGALGISGGLMAFGGRLIKKVGGGITKLNQIRAYSVALSAAITVIIASQLGLPVSSTHIAIGGVFGVGLLREFLKRLKGKNKTYIEKSLIKNIALAWIITLPVSAGIAAISYEIIIRTI